MVSKHELIITPFLKAMMSDSWPLTPYSASWSNWLLKSVIWAAGLSMRCWSVICVEETNGSTRVKSSDVFWKILERRLRCGNMSESMAIVHIKDEFFTKVARPAAVASWRSEASLSKLVINVGRHWRTALTASSWDNHLVSATSFSLTIGSPRTDWEEPNYTFVSILHLFSFLWCYVIKKIFV